MSYDQDLSGRIREQVVALLVEHEQVEEKPMFGGLSFLVGGHLAVCAAHGGGLLVRVPVDDLDALCEQDHVGPMVMGGRESRTWIRVGPEGVASPGRLEDWVTRGVGTARALHT